MRQLIAVFIIWQIARSIDLTHAKVTRCAATHNKRVYSDSDQRKHQSSTSLAFVCGEFNGDRTNGQ